MSDRYAFIEAERASFPIVRGCKLLKVRTSGYYGWSGRPLSPAVPRRARLAVDVSAAHGVSDGIFGYRRVHSELVEAGTVVSAHLVRRLMPEQDLVGAQPRAYRVTTIQDPDAVPAPDLLERNFTSSEPGSRLVGDITYVRTWAGWAYLAVVIDLASKMVVGWSVSNRATATLVIDALEMADRNGHLEPDAIFHNDRGCQFVSLAFGQQARAAGIAQSMGRTGVCWDNAQAETFFASLKVECVYRTALNSRPRKTLGWRTPAEALNEYLLSSQQTSCCDHRLSPVNSSVSRSGSRIAPPGSRSRWDAPASAGTTRRPRRSSPP